MIFPKIYRGTVFVNTAQPYSYSFSVNQVSNQCMALVRDDCLVPTLNAPELGYVRESTSEQYVPDVFYKVKSSATIPRPLIGHRSSYCLCVWAPDQGRVW